MPVHPRSMAIVGAGLAGLVAARAAVGRAGRITVIDPRPDPRVANSEGPGRVDLLGPRAMAALGALGLGEVVGTAGRRIVGERRHRADGGYTDLDYARGSLFAIERDRLRSILVAALSEQSGVDLRFDRAVVSADPHQGTIAVARAGSITDGVVEVRADLLIGADGADSLIRDSLLRSGGSVTRDEHETVWCLLPMRAPSPTHPLAADRLHRWSAPDAAIVAFPDNSGLLIGSVVFRRQLVQRSNDLALYLATTFPSALAHATVSPAAVTAGGTAAIIETRVGRLGSGRCVLIGDAAGTALPFAATGSTMAIASASALIAAMTNEHEIEAAIGAYEALIRPEYAAAAALGAFATERLLETRRPDPIARLRPARRLPIEATHIAGPTFQAAIGELAIR